MKLEQKSVVANCKKNSVCGNYFIIEKVNGDATVYLRDWIDLLNRNFPPLLCKGASLIIPYTKIEKIPT